MANLETAVGEGTDGLVEVVHALDDTGTLKLWITTSLRAGHSLRRTLVWLHRASLARISTFVNVAVGMTGDGDRFIPVFDNGMDAGNGDGGAEDGTVGRIERMVPLGDFHISWSLYCPCV